MAKDQFQRTKPHVNVAQRRLLEAGMSLAGVQQLLTGQVISNPSDRALVAEIVLSVVDDYASDWMRTQQLNTQAP